MDDSKKTIIVLGRLPGILRYLYQNPEGDMSEAWYYLNHTRNEIFGATELPWDIARIIRDIPSAEQRKVFERLKQLLTDALEEQRVVWKFRAETYPYAPLWNLLDANGSGTNIDTRAVTLMRNPAQIRKQNLIAVLEHLGIDEEFLIVW